MPGSGQDKSAQYSTQHDNMSPRSDITDTSAPDSYTAFSSSYTTQIDTHKSRGHESKYTTPRYMSSFFI